MGKKLTNNCRSESIDLNLLPLQRPRQRPHQPDNSVLRGRIQRGHGEGVYTCIRRSADNTAL